MSAPVRHVRVTIDGTCTPVTDSHGAPTRAIRVRYLGADRAASTLLLIDSPNVQVQDVEPPRTWTDGDLVEHHDGAWAAHRAGGTWHTTRVDVAELDDERVTRFADPARGYLTVVRYQAGEQ